MSNKEKIEKILDEELNHIFSFTKGTLIQENVWLDKAKEAAKQRFMDKYNNSQEGDEFKTHVDNVGRHIGVNIGSQQDSVPTVNDNGTINMNDDNGTQITYEDFLKSMTERLTKAADELSEYVNDDGSVNNKVMYGPDADQYGKQQVDNANLERNAELMKCKDALDLLSLSYLYHDPNSKNYQGLITKEQKYKIIYNKLKKTNGEDVIEIIADSFDLSYANPKDVVKWATQGTRYGKLSKTDKEFDEKIASGKYRQNGDDWFRKGSYGDRFGNKEGWLDADGNPTNDEMFQAIKTDYYHSLLEKLINSVYGISLEMPGNPFTYGNAKLPSSSLIVNFTSAHRCPAWNECLVKYACYARTSEHGYKSLFAKNKRLALMWEGSRYDEQIRRDLFNIIRLYAVGLKALVSAYNKQVAATKNKKAPKYTQQDLYDIITTEGFAGLPNEIKELLKNGYNTNGGVKIKLITDIRLNEEGDFIGQWLLDAVDEFAGDLKEIDISVAAYTCRNLNFNSIKNIIINASKGNIGADGNGGVANAIARRFYAVPPEVYNSMDETYASQVDNNGKPVGEATYPTYVANKELFGDNKGRIIPYPQPLYIDGKETGQFYYKCPCGRGKHGSADEDENEDSKGKKKNPTKFDIEFNTYNNPDNLQRLKSGKNAQLEGVNCYDCRVCYQPKLAISDKPVVVLVQVHSANAELFNNDKASKARGDNFGMSKNYANRNARFKEGFANNNKPLITESIFSKDTSSQAIQQIAKYGEQSVHAHLQALKGSVQESAKQAFNEQYNRLFGKTIL